MSFLSNLMDKAKSFLGAPRPEVGTKTDSVPHDRYDAMLWKELLEEIPPLGDLVEELNEKHDYTEDMIRDVLMQFWQSDPHLRGQKEMDVRYLTNHAVSVDVEKAPETAETRSYTQHDKYGAACATIAVGDKVRDFLNKNKELEEEQEQANDAQEQSEAADGAAQAAAEACE